MRCYYLIIDALIAAASTLLRLFTVELLSASPNNVGTLALSEIECLTMSRFTPNSGKNHLYYGDNLEVLRMYVPDESVDLCYIDPPFNSKRNYNQIYTNVGKEDAAQAQAFVDTWNWDELAIKGFTEIVNNIGGRFSSQTISLISGLESVLGHSSLLAYVISMTLRVTEIHRALKPTGSFYFHCDPTSSHYLKLVIDSIFCPNGGDYKNEITWKRTTAHSDSSKYGNNVDIIFFYSKSSKYCWNQLFKEYDDEYKKRYKNIDADGRRWTDDNLTAKGLSGGGYEYSYKGAISLWRVPLETMERLDREGKLHFTRNGGIRFKRYLDEMQGVPLQALWEDISPLNSQAKERLGYPTQKPESLLERIIKASSNEGDVVLDAYCGCGTTVAVAQKNNRKWIGIDITYQAVSLILKRLEDTHGSTVVDTVVTSGIPKDLKSAEALATRKDDRTRKEFEKWAILTYSRNRATINEKKGADKGIDGRAYFRVDKQTQGQVVFQVKSGAVGAKDVRDLVGTMTREKAEMAVLITMKKPTKPMLQEAKECGYYSKFGHDFPSVQIISVEEILSGTQMNINALLVDDVLKSASRRKGDEEQMELLSA